MIDFQQMQEDYAVCYADKTRIKFIEKYLSTFNASAGRMTPFILFPRQKVFLHSIAHNKASIAIKHRQCGITTISSAWICAQMVFAEPDSPENVLVIANKKEQATELLYKIRDFLLQVPRWYWGDEFYSPDPKSEKNEKDIFVKNNQTMLELFNGCKVYARASSANAARGISAVSILIFDEAAFIEDGLATYSSAVAATASVPRAKIIMVSTPYGHDELYYNTYKQAIAKENNYVATEFKWYQDLRYNKFLSWWKKNQDTNEIEHYYEPTLDETGTIPYDEEHWRKMEQDGWKATSPWYEDMCKSFNNDSQKIAQELDVSFQGSANNVVDPSFIDMHRQVNVREPLEGMSDPLAPETWFWKPPIDGHRYVMSIDPSRGVSEDRTAIEVVDLDGKDDNGLPILEQVMEYVGKKLGDDIGSMAYNYGKMYNDAFVVVDATGGQGDALLLTLLNMGYKNLYYEDNSQKTYTVQNNTKETDQVNDRLPGFHFQGNRYAVLGNFAGMVRSNEFKIRSIRVINELETWIFKEGTGRMDHMSGAHDDTLTSLAMALFVIQFSLNKMESRKATDKAILQAYMMGGGTSYKDYSNKNVDMRPKNGLPMYNSSTLSKYPNGVNGNLMWLFTKKR